MVVSVSKRVTNNMQIFMQLQTNMTRFEACSASVIDSVLRERERVSAILEMRLCSYQQGMDLFLSCTLGYRPHDSVSRTDAVMLVDFAGMSACVPQMDHQKIDLVSSSMHGVDTLSVYNCGALLDSHISWRSG